MQDLMSNDIEGVDLVSRLSRASRVIVAWESFELGRGHMPPEHIRYPELAKLLSEAALALQRLEREVRQERRRRGEFLGSRGPE